MHAVKLREYFFHKLFMWIIIVIANVIRFGFGRGQSWGIVKF